MKDLNKHIEKLIEVINGLGLEDKINTINKVRERIHAVSPFVNEPVDLVLWKKSDNVVANDYNPNSVAPPEMELLALSIKNDGYTQPVVSMANDDGESFEVVDGFHRTRVCKEVQEVKNRVLGYIPIVMIKDSQSDINNRVASTIRHNRARGKHKIDSMSDIVVDLKKRNWSPAKICKELGMDADEVLRLAQISGLVEMFKDTEFTMAWDNDQSDESEFEKIDD